MKKQKNNPLYEQWTPEVEKIFLQDALLWLKYKTSGRVYTEVQDQVVQWLYDTGRTWNVLKMDFAEFYQVMISNSLPERYKPIRRRRRYWGHLTPNPGEYRQGNKYRKKTNHIKKKKNSKQVWWEYKHKRDKRKSRYRRVPPRHFRNRLIRQQRQRVRQDIKHERWDNLSWNQRSPKDYWW